MPSVRAIGRIGLVVFIGSAILASNSIAQSAPPVSPCPMGSGMMMGSGMAGMMGSGPMGSGMMGQHGQSQTNMNLSVDDVRSSVERSIAMMGNPRLKPGKVVASTPEIIIADIVTVDKEGLVQRFEVNRHTGSWRQVP